MNTEQIIQDLRVLGLKEGDHVLLHSSLSSIGHMETGAAGVVEAFLTVLGKSGTLLVPTFGALGAIMECVKTHPKAISSHHPRAGISAIGGKALELTQGHWKAETAHGHDTPYTRLAECGGFVCLLGVDQDRNTTLHTIEALLQLPYLNTTEARTFMTPEGEVTKSWTFFPGPHRDFIQLDRKYREAGVLKIGKVGSAVTRLIRSKDLIDLGLEIGRKDSAFALCSNPECNACVLQRAALRKERLSKESFHLTVSASLAGRYIPEMVENMKKQGLTSLELDEIEGKPVTRIPSKQLLLHIEALKDAGIKISALRSSMISKINEALLQTAQDAGIRRVVLPLSPEAEPLFQKFPQMTLSLFNVQQDGATASDGLLKLKQAGFRPQFTFNSSHFALIGESPFLTSYKQKLNRFLDQLDIGDAVAGRGATPLGQGKAEIKEMISILRCSSFSGWMLLQGGPFRSGTLAQSVEQFEQLINAM